jgi:hypothetical protein
MKKKKLVVLLSFSPRGFGGLRLRIAKKQPEPSPFASLLLLAPLIRPLTLPSMVALTMSTFSKVSIAGLIQALIRNGSIQLVPGLAKAAGEVTNTDGTVTYTYTLRDGLKWSDGTSLTASDIVRSWKRAVSRRLPATTTTSSRRLSAARCRRRSGWQIALRRPPTTRPCRYLGQQRSPIGTN